MKKFLLPLLFLCSIFPPFGGIKGGLAQTNLVPNPSFEIYSSCPDNWCQIFRATGWQSFGYTPDYYHTCGTGTVHVPYNNSSGYQYPATGNGFAGIQCWQSTFTNLREYLAIELSQPLIINKRYTVGFKVVSADRYIGCRINKIGLLFSTVSYALDTSCQQVPSFTPQNFAHLYTDSILTDTLNWKTISSNEFIADSAYTYIIIGNFFDDANIDTLCFYPNNVAYYYIDDIFVYKDTLTDVDNKSPEKGNMFFANPASEYIKLFAHDIQLLTLKNIYGTVLTTFFTPSEQIRIDGFENGIYICEIKTKSSILYHKLIINR